MARLVRRNRRTEPTVDPSTNMTVLATGRDGRTPSRWEYTEVEEPERFSAMPHMLAVAMQSLAELERQIFDRIDAIHAAGGLDLGHFDVADGYLKRRRASVDASLVQQRDERRKTAGRLTGIMQRRVAAESLRVVRLRDARDELRRLRDEVIAELHGPKPDPVHEEPGSPVPPRRQPARPTRAEPLHLGHNTLGHNNNYSKERP